MKKFFIFAALSSFKLFPMESIPMLKALAACACAQYKVNIKNVSSDIKGIVTLYKKNLSKSKVEKLANYKTIFLSFNDQKNAEQCDKYLALSKINKRPEEVFKEVVDDASNKRWLDQKAMEDEWTRRASALDIHSPELMLEIQNDYFKNREKQYNHYRIGLAIGGIVYSFLMSGVLLTVFLLAEGENND